MNLQDWLVHGFEYELWADRRWMAADPSMPEPRHAEEILSHVLWASETWLSRVTPDFKVEEQPFEHRLVAACQGWIDALYAKPLEEVIDYRNLKGEPFRRQFGGIALQVINHGTYHRGQLRGLAAEQGFEDFPETDVHLFFIEEGLYGEPG